MAFFEILERERYIPVPAASVVELISGPECAFQIVGPRKRRQTGLIVAELLYHNLEVDSMATAAVGGSVSIGNFDGVHLGHRQLINRVTQQAKELGAPAVVVTFDPPPIAVLKPELELPPPLTILERRAELLGDLGIDFVIALRTDKGLLSKGPGEFFKELLVDQLRARALTEGPNFRFGRDRQGDGSVLQELSSKFGIGLSLLEATVSGAEMISSTRIRKAIRAGEITQANAMLSAPYQFSGRVHEGEKRGRELGFPTANLDGIRVLMPEQGVFAAVTNLGGVDYPCAVHIGPNPTFSASESKVEVHVVGWSGDLYGQSLSCRLLKKVRDIKKFDSVEALKTQIASDVKACVGSL